MIASSVGIGGGCIQVDPYRCQSDVDCVFEGKPGRCRPTEAVCIYPDATCGSQWSAADGECMPPVADADPSTGTEASGSETGSSEDSGTTGPSGECDATGSGDITALGEVWASSVFEGRHPATLAVDDDYATSWLSAGLDLEGNPSLYEWTADQPRCITRVAVIGNAMHQNPEFHEGYGFENMIMRIYDQDDVVVFQRMFNLAGSPDPDAIAEPEVVGMRIELELFDHEIFFSGGFSELEVDGR